MGNTIDNAKSFREKKGFVNISNQDFVDVLMYKYANSVNPSPVPMTEEQLIIWFEGFYRSQKPRYIKYENRMQFIDFLNDFQQHLLSTKEKPLPELPTGNFTKTSSGECKRCGSTFEDLHDGYCEKCWSESLSEIGI